MVRRRKQGPGETSRRRRRRQRGRFGGGSRPKKDKPRGDRPAERARLVGLVAIDVVAALLTRRLKPWSIAASSPTLPASPSEKGANARRVASTGMGTGAPLACGRCLWALVGSGAQAEGRAWAGGKAVLMRYRRALRWVKERCSRPGERRARKGGAPRPAAGTSGSPSMLRPPSFYGKYWPAQAVRAESVQQM